MRRPYRRLHEGVLDQDPGEIAPKRLTP
eukprot:COSAG02_NODE_36425_length_454_cov_1.735211_1_plen_27_part_01